MGKRLKVAIVGCGHIADGHVGEIKKIDNAVVSAVCDLEPIMAEQLASRFDIPHHFSDFQLMLDQIKPDVVHICTPPSSHFLLTKMSVDAGCHVYVEKPLAIDYEQSVALINYVQNKNLKITIGHNSQFDPPSLEMRKLVKKGVLGEAVHIDSWFGYNLDGPFGKAILGSPDHWVHQLPGKLFQNNLNHMLNKITEFLDDDKPLVQALAWRQNTDESHGDIRDEFMDELRVIIKGKKVSAYGTFTSNVKPVAQFSRIYGTNSIIHLDYVSRTVTVDKGATLPSAIGRLVSGYSQAREYGLSSFYNTGKFLKSNYHYFAGMKYLIEKFYDCIIQDTPLPVSTRDMLRIAWIMDEIFSQITGVKE